MLRVRWLIAVFAMPLLVIGTGASPAAEPDKYRDAIRALDAFVAHEVAAKELPALSIALVDEQAVIWSKGFGFADPKQRTPATADTVYRVGSVSKLFTDIAVMQLVEQGKLDLDAPVNNYLPEFKPRNLFKKPITLRHLMAHRSGLMREPPVGNYFELTAPSLEKTVESLNQTELVFEPGMRVKYSNAGIAVVGYVLEKTQQVPFAKYVQQRVLEPLGMRHSSFAPTPELVRDLAKAQMWTYHGRTFDAPTFELGIAPAGSMYSTVTDLTRFLSALFLDDKGIVLKPDTLKQMWQPQFAKKDAKTGFGLGFMVEEFEGRRRLGHNGAVYGFATELAVLPDDKLGVVVVTSKDCANGVATHIANVALSQLLAARNGKPLPKIETTKPVAAELAQLLAGGYRSKERTLDLVARDGKLWMFPERAGLRLELRAEGERLIVDDLFAHGVAVKREKDGALKLGPTTYERVADELPKPAPDRWTGLIGEYGWDHNTLFILEKHGKLHALIEWFFLYPLEEVSENVYRFPDFGLYHDEKLVFKRDGEGRATQVEAANVVFPRRKLDGEYGAIFRIQPIRPVEELRRAAIAAKPPAERGEFGKPELTEVTTLDPTIKTDLRYATSNNFLATPVYSDAARAYLQKPAAEALVRINRSLAKQGYGLLIHDSYRPWAVTKIFWDSTPDKFHMFVADPSQGSRHNRGCAVDLTLYDKATGKPIEMVGGYDEFSDRSFPEYLGGTGRQRWHRDLLRREMEKEGFTVYENEWWHFDYRDWRKYPILNLTFEQLNDLKR